MKSSNRKFVTLLFILLLIAAAVFVSKKYFFAAGPDVPGAKAGGPVGFAMPVITQTVEIKNFDKEIEAIGELEAAEIADVKSEIKGNVKEIKFQEGQKVTKGQTLVIIDDRDYRYALDRARSTYELARVTQRRNAELLSVQAISRDTMDRSQASLDEALADYDLAKMNFERTKIKAPFSGVVSFKAVDVGDFIDVGTSITQVVDNSKMRANFSVAEKYGAKIKIGQLVKVNIDADPETQFTGNISAIDSVTDSATRTIRVKALIGNKTDSLKAGMSAYVKIKLATEKNKIFVPEEAVVNSADEIFIFRVINGIANKTNVTTGEYDQGTVEITSGLEPGDNIILAGYLKVKDQMPVMSTNNPALNPAPDASQNK